MVSYTISPMSVDVASAVASSALARAPTRMLVGGDWLDAGSGETFTDVDPATGTPLAEVHEVLPLANGTCFGLAAGLWTRDVSTAHRLAARLQAGSVYVNCFNVVDPALPFGGFKQSGCGRDLGPEAIALYTETKAVCVRL